MAEGRIRCALVTSYFSPYMSDLCFACPGLEVVALSPSALGPVGSPNPFALPEHDRADAILIEGRWYEQAAARQPDRIDGVMADLEGRAEVLVGLDGEEFALGFPPSALERLARVIKFDGIYRDRDLYNYLVGPRSRSANWTEKLRPRPSRYRQGDLGKLRLSLPCFARRLPPIRRAARARMRRGSMPRAERIRRNLGEALLVRSLGLAGGRGRRHQAQCLVAPSHPQRIEAVRLLDGLSGTQGLAVQRDGSFDDYVDYMLSHQEERAGDREALLAAARPLAREPMSRLRYLLDLRRHKVAVVPTGIGELTYRHGEALLCGAALVCQDLSHVEMMYPFRDRENVAFCRPDLSDLRSTVEELLADEELRRRIAHQGRRTYMAWAARWREHLYEGIERHIRETLGST